MTPALLYRIESSRKISLYILKAQTVLYISSIFHHSLVMAGLAIAGGVGEVTPPNPGKMFVFSQRNFTIFLWYRAGA